MIQRLLVSICCSILIWTGPAVAQKTPKPSALSDFSNALRQLVEQVSPTVVQVFSTGYAPGSGYGSAGLLQDEQGSGSGIILDPDGYIVTNAHVVSGARKVQVLLALPSQDEGDSVLKPRGKLMGAQVVRIDWETDLAVLKISGGNLPYLKLGDSDQVHKGQLVLAFGSPLRLEESVSMGIVSSRARQLERESPMIYIQTDAAINPGNSGGPLVNTQGQVIGINTLIFSHSGGDEGLGFAVPSNIVRTVFEQIRATGRMRRGIIGVRAQTITPALAAGLGLGRETGVILSDVIPQSPAANVGLMVGDVVLGMDGKLMENGRQFTVNLYQKPIGSKVALAVLRNGERQQFSVEVVERPGDPLRFVELVSPERNLVPRLGILCLEVNEHLGGFLNRLRWRNGVLVAARVPEAALWEEGFEPGDVIYALNGERVYTLDALRTRIEAVPVGGAAVFQIQRAGELIYVALDL